LKRAAVEVNKWIKQQPDLNPVSRYRQENPRRERECEEALTASRFSRVGCDVLGILTSPKHGEDDAGDSSYDV